jgi:hypothetical protein
LRISFAQKNIIKRNDKALVWYISKGVKPSYLSCSTPYNIPSRSVLTTGGVLIVKHILGRAACVCCARELAGKAVGDMLYKEHAIQGACARPVGVVQ